MTREKKFDPRGKGDEAKRHDEQKDGIAEKIAALKKAIEAQKAAKKEE